ncbi:MAG: Fic family protein [Anaerovoracaceae bacterium]
MYIYENKNWKEFSWDSSAILTLLGELRNKQGKLLGEMNVLGFEQREEATLAALTTEITKSSEIEGEKLNKEQVRSSVARKLGVQTSGLVKASRDIDSIVEMMLDATQNYQKPLSLKRLYGWHASLFPTGFSSGNKIEVGKLRSGAVEVISGKMGSETVHYIAPPARMLKAEMKEYINWFNSQTELDSLIKAAIAHFYFVTIHPFDDGNGRLARAITEMQIARSDNSKFRFYSMSNQIQKERKEYYSVLEKTQKVTDLTEWIFWFLSCLSRTIDSSEEIIESTMKKAKFWKRHQDLELNTRQRKILIKLFSDFEGELTSAKWSKMAGCSADTALRDINDLISKKVLAKNPASGRSTSYHLIK